MSRPLTAPERIVITIAVCLTIVVAAPMTVLAATGQLVNIVDPSNASRQARVTAIGALQVQARLGIPSGAIPWQGLRDGTGWISLGSVAAPNALAITEITGWAVGQEGVSFVAIQYTTVDTAAACPSTPAGTVVTIRRMLVPMNTQEQVVYPSPLFVGAASTGKRRCYYAYAQGDVGSDHYVGMTGYQYAP